MHTDRAREGGKGSLQVRAYKDRPFYEARWRDTHGTQRRRRLGPAWVERDGEGRWVPRRGRACDGRLDERHAYSLMAQVIAAHEDHLRCDAHERREATFEEAAATWLAHLRSEGRVRPSTLRAYRCLLAESDASYRGSARRIMRAFGGRSLSGIATEDVRRFLSRLDLEDLSPRTVNIHRQVLHAIFEFARQKETFGLPVNPVARTSRRAEKEAGPIESFEPGEIRAIAAAARQGRHLGRSPNGQPGRPAETERVWRRIDDQDASLFVFAATTGLRLGELRALRWRDVDLEAGYVTVTRAISAGEESGTKSRVVPLAAQATEELGRLRSRPHFLGREDHVFCRADGGPLDDSAVRRRFIKAQEAAGLRVRKFDDLRHTFGTLATRCLDLVAVKEMMGHASLATTERYLSWRPRPADAATLTAIISEGRGGEGPPSPRRGR